VVKDKQGNIPSQMPFICVILINHL